jgi:hypothetical protein
MHAGNAYIALAASLQQGLRFIESNFHIQGGHADAKNIHPRPLGGLRDQVVTYELIRSYTQERAST